MSISRRTLLLSTGAAALAAACSKRPDSNMAPPSTVPPKGATDLNRQLDAMTEALLREFPENATFRGVDQGAREALKHQLSDRSNAGRAARTEAAKARLASLRAIDRTTLPPEALAGYDSAIYAHELAVAGAEFAYGDVNILSAAASYITTPFAVTQLSGNFVTIPDFLNSVHVIDSAAGAEAFLDRVKVYGTGLDQETDRLVSDAAQGVVAPRFVISNIGGQIEASLKPPVAEWSLVAALGNKTKAKGIPGDWEARVIKLLTDLIHPALVRQHDRLTGLLAQSTNDAGAWKLPRGDAYYAWTLKAGTTTDHSAEEIHNIGLEQVKEIEARMDTLLKAQGLTKGTPGERVEAMSRDPKFLFPNTDQGRTDLIAYLNGRVAAVRPRLPELFRTLPKVDLVIKRVPPEIEAGAPNGYEIDGSLDGTRPANYYINLRTTASWPRFLLPTLTFHEGFPGHAWQGAYAGRLPLIRSLLQFNAYTEGWALYCEQLADEIGLYQDDPFGRIGYLSDQMLRACRLVVDTGLHAKRWTREQSVQFMVRYTGQPVESVQSEVDRYCAMPGQACGYMMGRLEIDRQRERAKQARGVKFDIRDFNDAMVLTGSVPLTVLADVTDRYIASS
jgi:uncharacterized protein (DUF885 family)